MGKMDLWRDEKDSIANRTMQSLGAILTSYQSLQVDEAALEFKITILSKDHAKKWSDMAQRQRQLRKKLPKNILGDSDSENELVSPL